MFDLANDRYSYGEMLRPDAGYKLDFAVGMTYSLDLEALLGVPISLGMLDDMEEGNRYNPLCVLEAIRKSADRIALFCNAGNIKLPAHIQSVYSLLENSVFQVKRTKTSNFHPKLWVLKYSADEMPSHIRLLVMSRNLTFDNSIDVVASLRGEMGETEGDKNRPLADLLRFAADFAGRKKQQVLDLAEDVLKVLSFDIAYPFVDYDFFPIGISGYDGADCPLFGKKSDLFAVSPFLSDETISRMIKEKKPCSLVTRKDSVTPAVLKTFDHVYVTKDVLTDNEYGAKQDIHAKIYYTTTPIGNYLYLGSANASRNAFSKNVECLLRLKYSLYYMGYKRFFKEFLPDKNCPFEEVTSVPKSEPEDPVDKEAEKALREAVFALKRAYVTADGEAYTVRLESRAIKTNRQIMISPLQCRCQKKPLEEHTLFSGVQMKELSEFYVLSVEVTEEDSRSLIVKVPTSGIPKNRDQEIYRSIIDSKPMFRKYLSLVLSGDLSEDGEYDETDDLMSQTVDADLDAGRAADAAVYEQMLRVFHQDPAKLKGISDMVRRLDPEIVGDDFRRMFRSFEEAARKVRS